MADKIKIEILGLSTGQAQSGSFALVLGEMDGRRRLPIIIGMFGAQAIAIEIEKITPNRLMTHDLFKSFGDHFSFTVTEIFISELKEGVFFAKIIVLDFFLLELIKYLCKRNDNKDSRNRTHTCDFEDHCSTTKLYP